MAGKKQDSEPETAVLQMPVGLGTATITVSDDDPDVVARYKADGWTEVDDKPGNSDDKPKTAPAHRKPTTSKS